jgi:hypothetical protein
MGVPLVFSLDGEKWVNNGVHTLHEFPIHAHTINVYRTQVLHSLR